MAKALKQSQKPRLAASTQNALDRFADKMGERLAANSWKPGWRKCTYSYLRRRLSEEVKELTAALLDDDGSVNSCAEIAREAADVANFAMFIAEKDRRKPRTTT